MKKVLSLFLAVAILFAIVPTGVFVIIANAQTDTYYTYTTSYDGATITDVDTAISGDISIPETLGGYSVICIGEYAFSGCTNLKSVVIPYGVTSIGGGAFKGCASLKSITVPNSVTSIGWNAFKDCCDLKSIVIPDSITSIDNSTFNNCTDLENITIPNSVISIGSNAFHDCFSLMNITIPNSVTSIGNSAFDGCRNLRSITVPDSVTSIGIAAVGGCKNLRSITLPFVGGSATANTYLGYIFGYSNSDIPSSLKTVVISDACQSISSDAFEGCKYIENLTLPFVGQNADGTGFSNFGYIFGADESWYLQSQHSYCVPSSLKNVIITGSNSVEEDAFCGCSNLQSVVFCGDVKTIGNGVFIGCTSLKEVTLPASLTKIGVGSFSECDNLEDVYFLGFESQKNIQISSGNSPIVYSFYAEWHYNSCYGTELHTFQGGYNCAVCGIGKHAADYINIGILFTDTANNAWYSEAVAYVVDREIMNGYSGSRLFGTADGIQRQDFLVMLARFDGVDLSEYTESSGFNDVERNNYYESAVNWGVENGITTGYNSTTFGVGDMITREQIVTFLYRYAQYKGLDMEVSYVSKQNTESKYYDFGNVSDFSKDAVYWAIDRGVINGKENNTAIAPQGNAQRCEVAQIMYNIFKNEIF